MAQTPRNEEVLIRSGDARLPGMLSIPSGAQGLVLFAHGSGSGRFSPRNRFVATELNRVGVGTLLFDLLTPDEQYVDERTAELRFDIGWLTGRLDGVVQWVGERVDLQPLRIGLFGASTGAAAALGVAALRGGEIGAVVSRGGRPDLTGKPLADVTAPTLLIVGGLDGPVIAMNREAAAALRCEKRLEIVEGATHLFEEAGKLERVAALAADWFKRQLER